MKKIINFFKLSIVLIILILTAGVTSYKVIEAQEKQSATTSSALNLTLKQLTQDPETGEFKILLSIVSTLESDRVKVTWNFPKYFDINSGKDQFISIKPQVPSIVEASFTPKNGGEYDIEVVVEIMKADVNYISSATQKINLDANKRMIPQTEQYLNYQRIYQARDGFKILSIALTVLGVVIVAVSSFFRWLNSDDNVKSKQ